MTDICTARGSTLPPVVNIIHPHPTPWAIMINKCRDALSSRGIGRQPLAIVPFGEWKKQVFIAAAAYKGSKRDVYNRFPILMIQKALNKGVDADENVRQEEHEYVEAVTGTARMDLYHASKLSGRLRDAPQLGRHHVEKWVDYWQKEEMFASNELHRRAEPMHRGTNSPVFVARL